MTPPNLAAVAVLRGSWYNIGRNVDELLRKFTANLYASRKTNEVWPSAGLSERFAALPEFPGPP